MHIEATEFDAERFKIAERDFSIQRRDIQAGVWGLQTPRCSIRPNGYPECSTERITRYVVASELNAERLKSAHRGSTTQRREDEAPYHAASESNAERSTMAE